MHASRISRRCRCLRRRVANIALDTRLSLAFNLQRRSIDKPRFSFSFALQIAFVSFPFSHTTSCSSSAASSCSFAFCFWAVRNQHKDTTSSRASGSNPQSQRERSRCKCNESWQQQQHHRESRREKKREEAAAVRESGSLREHARIQAQPQGGKHTHLWIAENYATAAAAGGGTRQQQQQVEEGAGEGMGNCAGGGRLYAWTWPGGCSAQQRNLQGVVF